MMNARCLTLFKNTLPLQQTVWRQVSSKTQNLGSDIQYCIQLVKKFDYENFLCTLLLPKAHQSPSFVLRAFNIEVAKVQDSVSEVNIGHVRLQFWENAVDNLYTDNVPVHPVVQALNKVEKLSKRNLRRLVTARLNLLQNKRFLNIEELEAHSENVVSCLFYLQLQVAGISDLQADHTLSHIGKAQGITNILRSVPYIPRSSPLPLDILATHKVSQEMLIRQDTSKATQDAVFQIASAAKIHLDKARSLKAKLPPSVLPFLLPSVAVTSYLDRLQKADFNLFHPHLKVRDGFLPAKLWWNKTMKTY
uniref:NADH dehydrogenase (Ubiquinone) complex I, assembly factor 6 n=1 Tax=Cacopsylla melanoneura TaxID=428564 RepID=A0A8D8T0J1_9HEMI